MRQLADITFEETPPTVEHEAGRRRTFVSANVRGRDVAGFVSEAQEAIRKRVPLPPNYEVKWGGDFQNLQSASLRLAMITPIVLFVIYLLLYTTFGSGRLALLIFLAVPMAASGGVFALALRGMPFSISAGVGFIALFGVAVLNGLVWVSAAEHTRESGADAVAASNDAALVRLRPVLMTALVASLGFLPMALSTSDGAEMQRPLATVVIGGVITSTLLTSLVIPAIYPWFAPKHPGRVRPSWNFKRVNRSEFPERSLPNCPAGTAPSNCRARSVSAESVFVGSSNWVTAIRPGDSADASRNSASGR